MNCIWCQNPETIHNEPELEWYDKLCINCNNCEKTCKENAISRFKNIDQRPFFHKNEMRNEEDYLIIDKNKCNACGRCSENCPGGALKVIGKEYTVESLLERILKDEKFIKRSGGGFTFSGGEPALQYPFIVKLAKNLKELDFHLALDTAGMAAVKAYQELLPFMDMILFDIKEIDNQKHQLFTGHSNERILSNLLFIIDYLKRNKSNIEICIRTPLIPEFTATMENIDGIGKFIKGLLIDQIYDNKNYQIKWELCSFNNLCKDKYRRLGVEWELERESLLTEEAGKEMLMYAKKSVDDLIPVTFSGLTKKQIVK